VPPNTVQEGPGGASFVAQPGMKDPAFDPEREVRRQPELPRKSFRAAEQFLTRAGTETGDPAVNPGNRPQNEVGPPASLSRPENSTPPSVSPRT